MSLDTCLFLCGDVMTGRGIDQILPHSVDPTLYEFYVRSAIEYVDLAENVSGPVPRQVDFDYIWGDAMNEWRRMNPDGRIINLETAVTLSEDWLSKGINYRMHPTNLACLTAAQIDCCVLANNHVLDWGVNGLLETLKVLRSAVAVAGAGENASSASSPAILSVPGRRVLVFSAGTESSGISPEWAATNDKPGVWFLEDLSIDTVEQITSQIKAVRRPEDIVIFSIHWGGNWGYDIPREQRHFARELINRGQVDLIHGHSSHHPKGIEVYQGKPILYGCGDFINDYEGIRSPKAFRSDLSIMYFPVFDSKRQLVRFTMTPMQIRQLSLHYASTEDAEWLSWRLAHESEKLNTKISLNATGILELHW